MSPGVFVLALLGTLAGADSPRPSALCLSALPAAPAVQDVSHRAAVPGRRSAPQRPGRKGRESACENETDSDEEGPTGKGKADLALLPEPPAEGSPALLHARLHRTRIDSCLTHVRLIYALCTLLL